MFFEGSEKKAEIIINTAEKSLLKDYSLAFWSEMVICCGAKIISTIENQHLKAFLLSESSLFVWEDRLLILTCGDTKLVDAIIYFLGKIDLISVKQVIYQRKNEYCSHLQSTHVLNDAKKINAVLPGTLLRFGELDSHHNYLFYLNNKFIGDESDKTYEVLIYNIDKNISKKLTQPNITNNKIRELLQIEKLLPNFIIDDYVFEPFGYSLNAIRAQDYFTIHLTPQPHNSYVSFESNINLVNYLPLILNIFNPTSFDIMSYNEPDLLANINKTLDTQYKAKELVKQKLSCCYLVTYTTFNREQTKFNQPIQINLEGELNVF